MDRVQQIIAEAEAKNERFRVLFRLLAYTGLRIGEALALEWQHIDVTGKRVLVGQTTTRRTTPPLWIPAFAGMTKPARQFEQLAQVLLGCIALDCCTTKLPRCSPRVQF